MKCPGTFCSKLVGRPEHLDSAFTHPMEVEGDVTVVLTSISNP